MVPDSGGAGDRTQVNTADRQARSGGTDEVSIKSNSKAMALYLGGRRRPENKMDHMYSGARPKEGCSYGRIDSIVSCHWVCRAEGDL